MEGAWLFRLVLQISVGLALASIAALLLLFVRRVIIMRFEAGGCFRTGDYWLIPARPATRDILWPSAPGQASAPRGPEHFYALLAIFENGKLKDLRRKFRPLSFAG